MLEELNVRNYALIENLSVRFTDGLNILTGETGAGKSILIGALGLILGPIVAALFVTIWEMYGVVFRDVLPPGRIPRADDLEETGNPDLDQAT